MSKTENGNIDKRIRFLTKEESNTEREQAFLALTPSERFMAFIKSFDQLKGFESKEYDDDSKGNFIIQ